MAACTRLTAHHWVCMLKMDESLYEHIPRWGLVISILNRMEFFMSAVTCQYFGDPPFFATAPTLRYRHAVWSHACNQRRHQPKIFAQFQLTKNQKRCWCPRWSPGGFCDFE